MRPRRHPARRGTAAAACLAAAVLLLPAGAATAAGPGAPAVEGPAWVRAAHLVPDLPRMDIDLGPRSGQPGVVVDGAGYGDVSTYSQVPAGAYDVGVRPAGSAPGTTPVLTSSLQAEAGRAYTVVALGSAADARIVPLEDDLTPPAPGEARVRVLSAASTASAVDVAAVDGPSITRGAPFASSTSYTDVPAGRWTLRAQPAAGGTGTGQAGTTDVVLAAGSTYTLAVTDGRDGASALAVTPVADASGAAGGVLPAGGAATGGGGEAAPVTSGSGPTAAAALLGAGSALAAAAALWLLRARGRTVRP
ncbi:DUF4397 domain-containing protein [Streptomyces sp. NP160]|uniref:DUF4397 domain-containing protein n=1 Tax=Streptomyces sp. NP160 TaxID=2586637 RepID=UPI00111AD9F0|nr:DUF4397 domain-containing protein [Streptomyces sp. NP160]TNM64225.1 DUF4397 domain-containing protein [Streptomyces sp. NP160]